MIDLRDIFKESFDNNIKDININYTDTQDCISQFLYLSGDVYFAMDRFIYSFSKNQEVSKGNLLKFKPIYEFIIKIINIIKKQHSVFCLTDIYYNPDVNQLYLKYIFVQDIKIDENNLITFMLI